jgi:preprotein translocase subunit YajC
MFSSIAFAQETAPAAAPTGMFGSMGAMLPLFAMIAIFYFLMIRPQQKKAKQLNETINALKAGDQIVTTSGFLGTVEQVIDPNTFLINLGSGAKVQILRSGIAGKRAIGAEQANIGKK